MNTLVKKFVIKNANNSIINNVKTVLIYIRKKKTKHTLFNTLLTSLAKSLEHTSKWKILPQFDTHAPRS